MLATRYHLNGRFLVIETPFRPLLALPPMGKDTRRTIPAVFQASPHAFGASDASDRDRARNVWASD